MASLDTPRYQFPYPQLTGQDPSVPVDTEALAVAVEASLGVVEDTSSADRARIVKNEDDIADLKVIGGDFPAGIINMYGGQTPPGGWLLCDGSSRSTATYADLFAAIGYGFGGSGGAFNVPNLQTRVPLGASGGVVPGVKGGASSHAVSVAELPVHNHSMSHTHGGYTNTTGNHHHRVYDGGSSGNYHNRTTYGNTDATLHTSGMTDNGNHSHSIATNSQSNHWTGYAGSNHGFSLLQPYLVVNFIIRH